MKLFFKLALLFSVHSHAYALHDYPADEDWQPFTKSSSLQIDHSQWQKTLDEFLISDTKTGINLVNYASLKKQGLAALNNYLSAMSAVKISNYNRAEQFPFWVNLYNAVTVKLIADNYPTKSIKKLGGWFSLGPWDNKLIAVNGRELSLNDIEHRILRPIWKDHRIHFVVNCASLGCPNIGSKALTAVNTENTLQAAAIEFVRHPRGLEFSEGGLTLSKIFNWYQSDFGTSEQDVLTTISQYLEPIEAERVVEMNGRVNYRYDWALNDTK